MIDDTVDDKGGQEPAVLSDEEFYNFTNKSVTAFLSGKGFKSSGVLLAEKVLFAFGLGWDVQEEHSLRMHSLIASKVWKRKHEV